MYIIWLAFHVDSIYWHYKCSVVFQVAVCLAWLIIRLKCSFRHIIENGSLMLKTNCFHQESRKWPFAASLMIVNCFSLIWSWPQAHIWVCCHRSLYTKFFRNDASFQKNTLPKLMTTITYLISNCFAFIMTFIFADLQYNKINTCQYLTWPFKQIF